MLLLRHAASMIGHLLGWSARSGLWWMPLVVPVLAVGAALVLFAKVVVPTVVYVVF